MSAGILRLEAKVLIDFLARLDFVDQILAGLHLTRAALVDGQSGIDEMAMGFHQPFDTVEVAAFLVGGQGQNQISIGFEAFLLQPDQVRRQMRRHGLVVTRAPAVEVAVLFEEDERIERPVFALRFDDIQVRQEQDRPAGAGAAIPRNEVAFPRIGSEHLNVRCGEPGSLQPRRHRFGRLRRAADRVGCVDLDEFSEDLQGARVERARLCEQP